MIRIKKIIVGLICLSFLAKATTVTDTENIRIYHQQLEEKVFELEEEEKKDQMIKESFALGQRRIKNALRNEKVALESKGESTSEKLKNLEILDEKYAKIMAQYEELAKEKEKLLLENKKYLEEINKEGREKK